MPWSAGDAKKHKKGLSSAQAKKWAKIANKVLADCKKDGKSQSYCEGKAIRVANSKFTEGAMTVEKRKIPRNAMVFREDGQFDFAGEGEKRTFSMVAYSGKVIKNHWLWGDLAIDVAGVTFPRRAFPILEEHVREYKIGFSKNKPVTKNNNIEIEEASLLSNERAEEFYSNAKEGFPYEVSISVRPSLIEELGEGEVVEVNGYKMKGPGTVFRKGKVREASVCTFGYDDKTSVSVFNDTEEKELELEVLRSYDKGNMQSGNDTELAEDTSEGTDVNSGKGGNQTMNLEELKEKYPELVKSIQDEATAGLRNDLAEKDRRIVILEDQNEQLKDSNKANEVRLASLEKSETIRREKELKTEADALFNKAISGTNIPERLYKKVRAQIDHGKFVEDNKLDVEQFSDAVQTEIKSWETDLAEAYSSPIDPAVQGMSNADGKGNSNKKEQTDQLVDRMVGYIVQTPAGKQGE